ncbi:MAG: aldehyde ferredoxin oxidoreductase family protein [Nitrososphaerota archaeon]
MSYQNLLDCKILIIDLDTENVKTEDFKEEDRKKYIGALGYAALVMLREVDKNTNPYDPHNILIWAAGALVGLPAPAINKSVFISRSPLTNGWGDALFSARAGIQLKKAGYDMVIIRGKASTPTYLYIHNGEVEFRSAENIWGLGMYKTFSIIKEELKNRKVNIVAIGPAGEKLVRIANIGSDDGRFAGRCGLGAVMGSKNLKAIAVSGEKILKPANEERFTEVIKEVNRILLESPAKDSFRNFGTSGAVEIFEKVGNLPVKNWSRGSFPLASEISGRKMASTILVKVRPCEYCVYACGRTVKIIDQELQLEEIDGPEYETIAMLGSNCLNTDLNAIAKMNYYCNDYGIDTISTGATIAFAMELYEKGIITERDTQGLKINWGDPNVMITLIHQIGKKEAFGAILSEGTRIASEIIGKGSQKYAMHVKGLELPAHSPYKFKCMGLNYATANRGACHNRGSPAYVFREITKYPELGWDITMDPSKEEGCGKITKMHQDFCVAIDAIGICKFVWLFGKVPVKYIVDIYNVATGFQLSLDELIKCGERVWVLQRLFNNKMGITRKDDTLPERFIKEPLQDGAVAGQTVRLDIMLEEYYKERGLDSEGRPTIEKLKQLDLEFTLAYM